jgi:hypothetical protein
MKFFILGDSWGVGEWSKKSGRFVPVPNTGLDYWLAQAGHSVTNISAGSAGNFGQLRHAYWTLDSHSDYDYMVWFNTERIRDIQEIVLDDPAESAQQYPDIDLSDLNAALDYVLLRNYQYAQQLYDRYQIPFIVIGGQSPVPDQIKDYSFAHWVIKSWLAELLDLNDVPPENTFFSWEKLQSILNHFRMDVREYILNNSQQLNRANEICKLAAHSERFPDNGHPGRQCFQQLADRILKMIPPARR